MASITPPEVKLFSRSEALQDAICVTALMKFANSPEDERRERKRSTSSLSVENLLYIMMIYDALRYQLHCIEEEFAFAVRHPHPHPSARVGRARR